MERVEGGLPFEGEVEALRSLVDGLREGIVIVDRSGRRLYANRSAERILGPGLLDAAPRGRSRSVGPYRRDGVTPIPSEDHPLERAIRGETVSGFEMVVRDPEGPEDTVVRVDARPFADGSDTVLGAVATIRPVAPRGDDDLRRERDFNAAVLETAGVPVLVADRDGRLQRFNPACERLSGHTAEEMLGRSLLDHDLLRGRREAWQAVFRDVFAGTGPVHRELAWVCRCGETRSVFWTFRGLDDGRGRTTHVVASGFDVTERKAAHEALERLGRRGMGVETDDLGSGGLPDDDADRPGIVGSSPALREVLKSARRVAPTATTVLLLGETGTGKGLLAERIHRWSAVSNGPFVHVDCVSLPPTLIEAELFGHERGAFTDAVRDRPGRFESAAGGTIFLDEIGDLPLDLQSKLLRVLQSGEFERVGSNRTRSAHARVIAATNRDIQTLVGRGAFRSDLYFRLSVFPVRLPPLRERREDIPALVRHFVDGAEPTVRREIREVPADVLDLLARHDWPGNVRELRNVVERALITATGGRLNVEDVRASIEASGGDDSRATDDDVTLEDRERSFIVETLERCGWRIKGEGNAADRLGLPPSTLRDKIRKLDIRRRRPR